MNSNDLDDLIEYLFAQDMMSESNFYSLRSMMTHESRNIVEKAIIGILADYDNKSAEPTLNLYMDKVGVIL